jgi:hypothetical protein
MLLKRVIAILVLVVIAVVAVRLAVGLVAGLVSAVIWVVVLAALVAGGLWARSTLKAGKREQLTERPPETHEDKVEAEMRRITEQLHRQGRG